MKLTIAIAAALFSTAALAQQAPSTLANVPTGYQVKGTTHYVIENDGSVRHVDRDKMPAHERVRAMVDPRYISTDGTTPIGSRTDGD